MSVRHLQRRFISNTCVAVACVFVLHCMVVVFIALYFLYTVL